MRISKLFETIPLVLGISFALGIPVSLAEQSSGDPNFAPMQLAQTSTDTEAGGEDLVQKGNQQRADGDLETAIATFREAESRGLGNEALTLDIADTYVEMGKYKEAYWEYNKIANSPNTDTAVLVCEQMYDLQWAQNRVLPDPYFADLFVSAGWQSIGDAAYIESRARLGGYTSAQKPLEYYLFADYARDNRSGLVGDFPTEYFENLAVLGVGIRQPLLDDHSLSFMAEAGRARELEDLGRERTREDYVAGLEYYKDWNMGYDCSSTNFYPNRFIFSLSSELKYYSRYNDAWLFEIEAKPGIRILETRSNTVDTFVKLFHGANLKEDENSYSEVGLGVTWRPTRRHDFSITASINETYFDGGDSDTNYGIVFEYYVSW